MISSKTMALYNEIKRELEDVNFICASRARAAWRGAGYYEVEPLGGRWADDQELNEVDAWLMGGER